MSLHPFATRSRNLLWIALLALAGCDSRPEERRPNVVLVVVDTMRGDAKLRKQIIAGSTGLTALMEDGVAFGQAFSHAPMTLPSHTALFSSRPPFETGVLNNWQDVREDLPLLAEWLQRYGFETHAVLSLGTLDPKKRTGLDRGFDHYDQDYWHIATANDSLARMKERLDELDGTKPFFFFAHFSDPHAPYNWHGKHQNTVDLLIDGEPLVTLQTSDMSQWEGELELEAGRHTLEFRSEQEHLVNSFEWKSVKTGKFLGAKWEESSVRGRSKYGRCAIDLRKQEVTKLRVWVSEPTTKKTARERYDAEVDFVALHVGQLIDELRSRGLYDDTIIVFTSDHGEALGERGVIGHVQNLHDEMIHVPLLIKLPKEHPAKEKLGAASGRLVSHQDIVPTLTELLVVPSLPGARGMSLLEEREPLLIAQTHKPESKRNLLCFRDERYKLVFAPDEDRFMMFDLLQDPREENDVFEQEGGRRAEWIVQIRTIADLTASGALAAGEIDAETREQLDALGYGGGE